MYRGRYQLGSEVPLAVLCTDGTGAPAAPDACPTVEVYGPSGKVPPAPLSSRAAPALDRYAATGLFQIGIFLGQAFSAGRHAVAYRWTTGGGAFYGTAEDHFEVLPGGDPAGSALAMYWYERPQASYLVRQHDSGRLLRGRNPRL